MSAAHRLKNVSTEAVEMYFLDFFHQRSYAILPGSPLLDQSIKMSFVMSAGLVQVERALRLTGQPLEHQFALVQSCFRHFDMMESVGSSLYHLSFFRMAAAFCFDTIDRRARIAETWDLLTKVYKLRPDALWVTYFHGGRIWDRKLEPDVETYKSWLDAGIPVGRIVGLEENFWKQSLLMFDDRASLKCGPNCEVFFDRGDRFSCGPECRPGCHCGRFVEILNILFVSWERDPNSDRLTSLSQPFAEIVIGVERMAMVMADADSVFEVDSLPSLCNLIEKNIGSGAVSGKERRKQTRLLADHLRAMHFLVADGAPRPGRGGRARIMRRLARNLLTTQILLDLPLHRDKKLSPVIYQMIDVLRNFYQSEGSQSGAKMLIAHPGLPSASETLIQYLRDEAELFEMTIERGRHKIAQLISRHTKRSLSGSEMLGLVVAEGFPEAYLARVLDQEQIGYCWDEYINERTKWQKSTKS